MRCGPIEHVPGARGVQVVQALLVVAQLLHVQLLAFRPHAPPLLHLRLVPRILSEDVYLYISYQLITFSIDHVKPLNNVDVRPIYLASKQRGKLNSSSRLLLTEIVAVDGNKIRASLT